MKTAPSSQLPLISDRLSVAELDKLSNRAMAILLRSQKQSQYILVKPENILAMIEEIKELRILANPEGLPESKCQNQN